MIRHARRILAHPGVKAFYFLLLVVVTAFYLVRWGDQLPQLLEKVQPLPVVAALAVTYLASLLYSYIQLVLYQRLGARASFGSVFRIVNISQLGKYLPGKVLFAGNFYLLSREVGIGNLQIGTTFTVSMALWILTASLCGVPALSLLQPTLRYSVLALPVLLALFIQPWFLGWLVRAVQWTARLWRSPSVAPSYSGNRRANGPASGAAGPTGGTTEGLAPPISAAGTDGEQQPEERESESAARDSSPAMSMDALLAELDSAFYLRLAFLYLATWAVAGAGAYLGLAALSKVSMDLYPLALASIALGTVAGFLALFAPVGLGIREGIGALILSPAVGADVALLTMVLMRGISLVVDLSLAVLALAHGRRIAKLRPG